MGHPCGKAIKAARFHFGMVTSHQAGGHHTCATHPLRLSEALVVTLA